MWLIIALFGFLCLGQALSGAYIKKWHQFSAPLKLHQLNSLSRFPRSVENNSQWFDFGLLRNMIGLENSSPCCPVRSNTKTNRGSVARVFPRLASAACLHLEFWLVHSLVCLCSLSLDRVFFYWFRFYDTQMKRTLSCTARAICLQRFLSYVLKNFLISTVFPFIGVGGATTKQRVWTATIENGIKWKTREGFGGTEERAGRSSKERVSGSEEICCWVPNELYHEHGLTGYGGM